MVGKVGVTIKGGKEIEEALKQLGPGVANRLGDRALRAAARVFIKEMKRLVPKDTRQLQRSITAVKGMSRDGERTVRIGFKRPAGRYAHLVEFGFSHTSGVHVAARPFMRPAMDGMGQEASDAMVDEFASGILKEEWKKSLTLMAEGVEVFTEEE